MAQVPPFLLVGTAIICVGMLVHVIGLSTTHWFEAAGEYSMGLFQHCGWRPCEDLPNPSSRLKAVRAMTIMGMLAGGLGATIAMILVLCRLLSKNVPKVLSLFSTAACFAAFVFIIIGIIIFGTSNFVDQGTFGYSFALCIVGAVFVAGGASLVFLGSRAVL